MHTLHNCICKSQFQFQLILHLEYWICIGTRYYISTRIELSCFIDIYIHVYLFFHMYIYHVYMYIIFSHFVILQIIILIFSINIYILCFRFNHSLTICVIFVFFGLTVLYFFCFQSKSANVLAVLGAVASEALDLTGFYYSGKPSIVKRRLNQISRTSTGRYAISMLVQ